jgi:LCP family protein required for cell wall assembly
MERSPEVRRRSRRKAIPDWLLAVLLLAFLVAAVATALLTFTAVRGLIASWRGGNLPGVPVAAEGDTGAQPDMGSAGNTPLQPEEGPPSSAWDGSSRVTVLIMGLDYRDWEEGQGAPRTDTMILLSIDPATRSAGMLSIPRDLWVEIPGFEPSKINGAYRLGEIYEVEGGGPALSMKTVENLLGMPVNFYAQIDFSAFVKFIDEIGGVKIEVPEAIEVDPLGDNNNKVLQPGVQVLPGDLALAYARARNTAGSDFDRAMRQQQVILGIRNRVLSSDMLPTLIKKAPSLYQTLSSGIRTNLTLLQAIELAWLAQQIPSENIKQGVIGPEQVVFSMSFDGQDILVPVPESILLLRDEIFTVTGPAAPIAPQTGTRDQMEAEAAVVSVLNGTMTPGLASSTADYLVSQGIQQVRPGNAEELYNETSIVDYTGNPNTVQYLVQLLGISPSQIYHRYEESSEVDVVILLGEDWADNNPLP